jgi:hypothetical protein
MTWIVWALYPGDDHQRVVTTVTTSSAAKAAVDAISQCDAVMAIVEHLESGDMRTMVVNDRGRAVPRRMRTVRARGEAALLV